MGYLYKYEDHFCFHVDLSSEPLGWKKQLAKLLVPAVFFGCTKVVKFPMDIGGINSTGYIN